MTRPRFQLVPGARFAGWAGGGVGWRLLGPNNRELGRSAGPYGDAERALAAIARARETVHSGAAHVLQHRDTALWAWQLEDSGVVTATSGRGFRHEQECRYNLEQFRAAAPTAPVSHHA